MSPRPNIVLIMTDQQRADFSRAEGYPLDATPFLDRFAAGGVRFRRAYTPMPVCGPARCSMLTGRFPRATHVRENGGLHHAFFSDDLVSVLRGAGYTVCLSGKNHSHRGSADFDFCAEYMHVGGGRPNRRTAEHRAFDQWLKDLDHRVSTGPTPFPLECQLPYRIVDDALECVADRRGAPFFLWLSFPEPHNPYQVPEPYFSLFPQDQIPVRAVGPEGAEGKGPKWRWMRRLWEEKRPGYDAQWRRYRANYLGMLRLIDDQVARFVAGLGSAGLLENTIVLFVSDHGDYAGDYGLQRKGVGLPECLVRVPMIWAGPGIGKGMTCTEAFVSLVDIFPTLCAAAGTEVPYGVQGRDLWPLLAGRGAAEGAFSSIYAELGFGGRSYAEDERPALHFQYGGPSLDELNSVTQSGLLKMVRRGPFKLLYDEEGHGELYDVERDPAELRDLWNVPAFAAVRAELTEELLRWIMRTEDPLPTARYRPKR